MDKQEYLAGMQLLSSFRADLPDGMWEEISEHWTEAKSAMKADRPVDFEMEAELVAEVLADYGFPSVWETRTP